MDCVAPHVCGSVDIVEFVVEAAGIADHLAGWVPPPDGGGSCAAVGTRKVYPFSNNPVGLDHGFIAPVGGTVLAGALCPTVTAIVAPAAAATIDTNSSGPTRIMGSL